MTSSSPPSNTTAHPELRADGPKSTGTSPGTPSSTAAHPERRPAGPESRRTAGPESRRTAGPLASGAATGLVILLALLAPAGAAALPSNRSIALEVSVGDARSPAVALSAGCWLEGEVEAEARLSLGSAPATSGRGAAGAVTPEVGLRWAPDVGRWRPFLALSVGVRLPTAGRDLAPTGRLAGGLERRLGEGWSLTAAAGARRPTDERAAWEAALGVRLEF